MKTQHNRTLQTQMIRSSFTTHFTILTDVTENFWFLLCEQQNFSKGEGSLSSTSAFINISVDVRHVTAHQLLHRVYKLQTGESVDRCTFLLV